MSNAISPGQLVAASQRLHSPEAAALSTFVRPYGRRGSSLSAPPPLPPPPPPPPHNGKETKATEEIVE